MIKLISFDMDNTLVNYKFDILLWEKEFPKFYAKQYNISLKEAKKIISQEWNKNIGISEWYIPSWWINYFKLNTNLIQLTNKIKRHIKALPKTKKTLKKLKDQGYILIVLSYASKEMINLKLTEADLLKFFDKIYSISEDFKNLTKEKALKKIIKEFKIKESEIIHIGNDVKNDIEIIKSENIKTIHLDKTGKSKNSIKLINDIFKIL